MGRDIIKKILILLGCMMFAAIPGLLALWLSHFSGLIPTLAYWFFSMWTITAVLMGLWGLFTGEIVENMDNMVWVSFFVNIPVQIFIANI